MNVQASAKTVVVSGDFTLDWNLARGLGLAASNRSLGGDGVRQITVAARRSRTSC